MSSWIVRVIANACALAVAAWLFTGITVEASPNRYLHLADAGTDVNRLITLVVVALIFGLVNEFIRPIVKVVSLPLYLLTLGLMFFIVNAFMLWLTSWLTDKIDVGFHVDGFVTALFGAIVVSFVSWVVGMILPGKRRR